MLSVEIYIMLPLLAHERMGDWWFFLKTRHVNLITKHSTEDCPFNCTRRMMETWILTLGCPSVQIIFWWNGRESPVNHAQECTSLRAPLPASKTASCHGSLPSMSESIDLFIAEWMIFPCKNGAFSSTVFAHRMKQCRKGRLRCPLQSIIRGFKIYTARGGHEIRRVLGGVCDCEDETKLMTNECGLHF